MKWIARFWWACPPVCGRVWVVVLAMILCSQSLCGAQESKPMKAAPETAEQLDALLRQQAFRDTDALQQSDQFEDNDTWDTAAPISPGTYLSLEALDADWYQLALLPGDTLEVRLWFTHAQGDLDLYIYDPSGVMVGYSNSSTDYESAAITASTRGRYLIEVSGYGGATNSSYDMQVLLTGSDWGEDNDVWNTAYPIPCDETYFDLRCADPDWYQLNVAAGASLDVGIYFAHAPGDLDLYVYDPLGALVAYSTSTDDNESIYVPSVALAGRYLIAVVGYNGAYNIYDMDVACSLPDDDFEPNDTWDTAAPISPGTYPDLQCMDEDWYSLFMSEAGSSIDVSLYFSNAAGDLDLYVYDPSGALVGFSESTSDIELVSLANITKTGRYLIQVVGYGGATNTYEMRIAVTSVPDDAFEQNDTWDAARAVSCGYLYTDLWCGDPDWYSIDLGAGDEIAVALYFSDAAGDLDLYLYDPLGYLVASSESEDDDEYIGIMADITGRWLIEVVGYQGAQNAYDMDISCVQVTMDDRYEENDYFSNAKTLDEGWHSDLLCADDDWFRVWVPSGDYGLFYIAFDNDDGDLDLEAYDDEGYWLTTSDNADDYEWILIRNWSGRNRYFYFVVYSYDGRVNSYDAYVEVGGLAVAEGARKEGSEQGAIIAIPSGQGKAK